MKNKNNILTIGSIVQVNQSCSDPGWIGALLIVTKIGETEIKGYLHEVRDRNNSGFKFFRCKFSEVDFVGVARIICIQETSNN